MRKIILLFFLCSNVCLFSDDKGFSGVWVFETEQNEDYFLIIDEIEEIYFVSSAGISWAKSTLGLGFIEDGKLKIKGTIVKDKTFVLDSTGDKLSWTYYVTTIDEYRTRDYIRVDNEKVNELIKEIYDSD